MPAFVPVASLRGVLPARDATAASGRPPAGRTWIVYALLVLSFLPLYILLGTERFTVLARVLGWLGLSLALLPAVVLSSRPASPRNGVAAIGLVIALFYQLGVFHERQLLLRWGQARISNDSVELALLLAALATPALWCGWYLAGALRIGRAVPHPRLDISPRAMYLAGTLVVSWSLLVNVLWIYGHLQESAGVISIISAISPMELGMAMLLTPWLLGQARLRNKAIFLGFLAVLGVLSLIYGMLIVIIRPLLVYLLGWLFVARRVRFGMLAVAVTVVMLMQPVKAEYRARVWDRVIELGLADRALLYLDLLGRHWLPGETDVKVETSASLGVAAARTGAALTLANVFELTPSSVPHQWGATYGYLLYAPIPRVLYPEKPLAQSADIWGAVMYGYTSSRGTSHVMVGLSPIAEAYINFRFAGALLLFLFLGAAYRVMDELLGHERAGAGALALYLYYLQSLMISFEGSLAQFWGGIVQALLLYGLGMALLSRFGRRRSAPRAVPAHALGGAR